MKRRAAGRRDAGREDGSIGDGAGQSDGRARRVDVARDVRARRHLELGAGDVEAAARRARCWAEIERARRRKPARHEEIERSARVDREGEGIARGDRARDIELGMSVRRDCQRLRGADDRQVKVAAGQVDLRRVAAARRRGR